MRRKTLPDIVMDFFQFLPGYQHLSYLELGCGDGQMLEALWKEGAQVLGTTLYDKKDDYIRCRDYPEKLRVDHGVDLNRPLPYGDETFDVVYSMEVIEHVEGHRNFISEVARVLKPGGWFVMTTPNLHRAISRIHFALCGVHLVKERRPPYSVSLERMGEFHIRCPDFPLLHWLMWQSRLQIKSLASEYVHPLSKSTMLLAPLFRFFTKFGLRRYQRPGEELDEAVNDLSKWMNSRILLTSERICMLAQKVEVAAPKV
ncbi:MAG: class I SAM-dependent methyltransferase [Rhizomicrobium sp.]